jgi:hypothetical protein
VEARRALGFGNIKIQGLLLSQDETSAKRIPHGGEAFEGIS